MYTVQLTPRNPKHASQASVPGSNGIRDMSKCSSRRDKEEFRLCTGAAGLQAFLPWCTKWYNSAVILLSMRPRLPVAIMAAKCNTWTGAKLRRATRLVGSETAKLVSTFDAYTAVVHHFDRASEIVIIVGRGSDYGVQSPRHRSEMGIDEAKE
jgi:hypothetical protein